MREFIHELYDLIALRAKGDPEHSYSAKMVKKGRKKIAQKIGEEATELVIEAIADNNEKMISESADLLYHLNLLWVDAKIHPDQIAEALDKRRTQSGIAEKKSRKY